MQFIRVFQHLLPRSPAWRLSFSKTLQKFFDGLTGLPTDVKMYADEVWLDAFPATTRQMPKWLGQFGLEHGADEAADVQQLTAAWRAQGGQDPHYLQSTLQDAGFPVYIHEWWADTEPFTSVECGEPLAQCGEPKALASSRSYKRFVRDPRDYVNEVLAGTFQCSAEPDAPECSALSDQPQCNRIMVNDPGYLVNSDLSHNAPPAIPDDTLSIGRPSPRYAHDWYPYTWAYFFYVGAATFPDRVTVPASRRAELERLVLKLRPTHQWVVMLVDYSDAGIVTLDDGTPVTLDDGTPLTL